MASVSAIRPQWRCKDCRVLELVQNVDGTPLQELSLLGVAVSQSSRLRIRLVQSERAAGSWRTDTAEMVVKCGHFPISSKRSPSTESTCL